MICPICHKRKAKRFCPARGDSICSVCCGTEREVTIDCPSDCPHLIASRQDRKSTRLNSSHGYISYAVFCLKKKNTQLNFTNDYPSHHLFGLKNKLASTQSILSLHKRYLLATRCCRPRSTRLTTHKTETFY